MKQGKPDTSASIAVTGTAAALSIEHNNRSAPYAVLDLSVLALHRAAVRHLELTGQRPAVPAKTHRNACYKAEDPQIHVYVHTYAALCNSPLDLWDLRDNTCQQRGPTRSRPLCRHERITCLTTRRLVARSTSVTAAPSWQQSCCPRWPCTWSRAAPTISSSTSSSASSCGSLVGDAVAALLFLDACIPTHPVAIQLTHGCCMACLA